MFNGSTLQIDLNSSLSWSRLIELDQLIWSILNGVPRIRLTAIGELILKMWIMYLLVFYSEKAAIDGAVVHLLIFLLLLFLNNKLNNWLSYL